MPEALSVAKGSLDLLVLKALAWGTMHGVEIIAWIEQGSRRALEVDDASVYEALYRMEKRGLVSASWGVTENNRRARYYSASQAGAAHLRRETARWQRYSAVVTELLELQPPAKSRSR
jgi:PadR family transcriptional regulator